MKVAEAEVAQFYEWDLSRPTYALNTNTGAIHFVWWRPGRGPDGKLRLDGLCQNVWFGYGDDPLFMWDEYPHFWKLSYSMPDGDHVCGHCKARVLRMYGSCS